MSNVERAALPINLAGPFGEGWSMYPAEARAIARALEAAAEEADRDHA